MIKKKKLSKEEKNAIKEFKNEENNLKIGKEKRKLKKEQLLLIGAIVVLITMIIALVYTLVFNKKYEVIVPDMPEYETVDIGLVDFKDEASDVKDLNTKKVDSLDVNYNIVSDYYKEGILLSNTKVDYLNSNFLVTSGELSKDSFISTISKSGKLNWITKLTSKDYDSISVFDTKFINDNYFVFTIALSLIHI